MRPKTIKRLAILIAVLSLVGWSGFLGQRYQITRLARAKAIEATHAEREGDFEKAETLYREHLTNVPGDVRIQLKYAGTLLKGTKSLKRQMDALQIYSNILRRSPGREDVRRLRIDLNVEMKRFLGDEGAEGDLKALLAPWERSEAQSKPLPPDFGNLVFLMGRCREEGKNDADAVNYYQSAIEHHASQHIEASRRLATLLHDRLNQPQEAEKVVERMINSDPNNYLAYLERGRYRRQLGRSDSGADFQKALELADQEPEVYLEMAKTAESESGYSAAQEILETGVNKAAASAKLYLALADLELRTGHASQAVETLEQGLKSSPEKGDLHLMLANLLAHRGDTGKLLLQIEELRSLGYPALTLKYFEAYYLLNSNEFRKAMLILVPIESRPNLPSQFKAQLNNLLARCYSQLGEQPMQDEALRRAQKANPEDLPSKLALIARMVSQGEIEGAIKEYRALVVRGSLEAKLRVRLNLARLLIDQNRLRPAGQRDWSEVKRLIDDAEKASRGSVEPLVVRADLYAAQDQRAEAQSELDKARSRFLDSVEIAIAQTSLMASQGRIDEAMSLLDKAQKQSGDRLGLRLQRARLWAAKQGPELARALHDLGQDTEPFSEGDRRRLRDGLTEIGRLRPAEALAELDKARARFLANSLAVWIAQANLKGSEGRIDEALGLLDQAQNQLGDLVELRLQRGRLSALKKGPEVAKALNGLAQNIESFSKGDQRKLLTGLALELRRQQDLEGASRLLSRLAEQEPNDFDLRLTLLDLAFQTANSDEIDRNIKHIERIEGNEGLIGRYCQVRHLIWQAQRAAEKDPQEARRLRTKASVLLSELQSRRENWSYIPLALAELEQQELAEGGLTPDEIQAKKESIVRYYRRAIDLGQLSSAVIRRTVQLLFEIHRGGEALELLNGIPVESQLAGDMTRQLTSIAVESGDCNRAKEIAQKALDANPDDLHERFWLAQVLLRCGDQDRAEKALRDGVDRSKTDPDRWIMLVHLLVVTKQPEKAAQAIKDAEAILPEQDAALALAQSCDWMGQAYEGNDAELATIWNAEAEKWYKKAAAAKPDHVVIARGLVEFFRRTKQFDKAESQLKAILEPGAGVKNANIVAWARRIYALTLASSTDQQRVRRALAQFEPADQVAAGGLAEKALQDPEDLRVLAQVLIAQNSAPHRQRAIAIMESLAAKSLANSDDRFLLARLHEINGDWPKAREEYRELISRTKILRDLNTFKRRPIYLAQFAESLLQHRQSGSDQELTDAQGLVDQLRQLQPDGLGALICQIDIYRARNQIDKAAGEIRNFADRLKLTPVVLVTLANVAETLNQPALAEQLYRASAAQSTTVPGILPLARFLSRRGDTKEALDICEPLWANTRQLDADTRQVEAVAVACIEVVTAAKKDNPAQLDRVAGWLDKALASARNPKSIALLLVGLGNIRERQERYPDAEALYQRAIEKGDRDATSHNNLAWLMALKEHNWNDALKHINLAIELKGPMPEFLDTRGVIYLGKGDVQHAIEDIENVVATDPSPPKLFHRAQAYLQANDKAKAKQYFQEAMAKGLPTAGLHTLEQPAYLQLLSELGSP